MLEYFLGGVTLEKLLDQIENVAPGIILLFVISIICNDVDPSILNMFKGNVLLDSTVVVSIFILSIIYLLGIVNAVLCRIVVSEIFHIEYLRGKYIKNTFKNNSMFKKLVTNTVDSLFEEYKNKIDSNAEEMSYKDWKNVFRSLSSRALKLEGEVYDEFKQRRVETRILRAIILPSFLLFMVLIIKFGVGWFSVLGLTFFISSLFTYIYRECTLVDTIAMYSEFILNEFNEEPIKLKGERGNEK